MTLEEIIQQPGATLIDVREPFEFTMGHAAGAVNIPLGSIPGRLQEIKAMKGPVIAYCRSGNRSGQAVSFLKGQGLREVYNAGTLSDANALLRHRA